MLGTHAVHFGRHLGQIWLRIWANELPILGKSFYDWVSGVVIWGTLLFCKPWEPSLPRLFAKLTAC
jgi:hypothetical protein